MAAQMAAMLLSMSTAAAAASPTQCSFAAPLRQTTGPEAASSSAPANCSTSAPAPQVSTNATSASRSTSAPPQASAIPASRSTSEAAVQRIEKECDMIREELKKIIDDGCPDGHPE